MQHYKQKLNVNCAKQKNELHINIMIVFYQWTFRNVNHVLRLIYNNYYSTIVILADVLIILLFN